MEVEGLASWAICGLQRREGGSWLVSSAAVRSGTERVRVLCTWSSLRLELRTWVRARLSNSLVVTQLSAWKCAMDDTIREQGPN